MIPELNKTQRVFLAGVGCFILLLQLYQFSEEGLSGNSWVFSLPIAAILWLPALSKFTLPRGAQRLYGWSAGAGAALRERHKKERVRGPVWLFLFGFWIISSCGLLLAGVYTLLPDSGASTPTINTALALAPTISRVIRFILYAVGLILLAQSFSRARIAWIWILAITIPMIIWQLLGDVRYELIAQEPAEAARIAGGQARCDSIVVGLHVDTAEHKGIWDFLCPASPDTIASLERLRQLNTVPARSSTNPAGSLPFSRFALELTAVTELLLSLGFLIIWLSGRAARTESATALAT